MYKNKELIIKSHRNPTDGLWDIILKLSVSQAACSHTSSPALSKPSANTIFHRNKTRMELAQCHHATAGSPPLETFFTAITKGNFQTWPGVDLILRKYLPKPKATIQGHLNQEQKNLQPTKSPSLPPSLNPALPSQPLVP